MRVDGSTRDVGAARNETIRRKRIERAERVKEVNKTEELKSVGYYEKRGMTKGTDVNVAITVEETDNGVKLTLEGNEREIHIETPEEAYRRQIAEMAATSKVYAKLQQDTEKDKKQKEDKEISEGQVEEAENEQDER